MGNRIGWLVLALLTAASAAAGEPVSAQEPVDQPYYGRASEHSHPDSTRLVVAFQAWVSEATAQRIHAGLGAGLIEHGYRNAFHVVAVPEAARERVLAAYRRRGEVAFAEPDYTATALWTPNDPSFFPYQWNFYDYGVLSNRVPSYYGVGAQSAWEVTAGTNVIVAVLDTGIAYEDYAKTYRLAPDLTGTSFVPGYDFANGDSHPNDDNGHGTHVAGTLAGSTNDRVGVAGLAFAARVMPVKVLGRNGSGYYSWIASGILFATDNGATVINLSLGGSVGSQVLYEAVSYAYDHGVTIVAAAGNDARATIDYPAAYADEVISVGATRFDGQLAPYSNYGPGVDLVAPGGDISVDQNHDGYGDGIMQQTFQGSPRKFRYYFFQGTSMATPHVSAVAALVWSVHPSYTQDQVRVALENSATALAWGGRLVSAGAIAY